MSSCTSNNTHTSQDSTHANQQNTEEKNTTIIEDSTKDSNDEATGKDAEIVSKIQNKTHVHNPKETDENTEANTIADTEPDTPVEQYTYSNPAFERDYLSDTECTEL